MNNGAKHESDDWGAKWRSPRLVAMFGVSFLLLVGGVAYRVWLNRPIQQSSAVAAAPVVETVSALGRLKPEGEVIQVFAPTSSEGARVEALRVSHGQHIRKGDVIAVLDTYKRRQAALQEAQEQLRVAQSRLEQVEAGAKSGEIRAQARVVDRQQGELQTETIAQEATIARLQAELRNAELEARRYQALYTEGAVSASLRDGNWNASTPVGYTFDLGMVIAFIVGAVIVYQILYSDVTDHLPEYATLKAMGFRDRYLLIVVFQESLILAALGFIPGTAIALGIYRVTNLVTMLPMAMDLGRIIFVFVLTVVMSSLSAAMAVRKLQTADPADIF